MPHHAGWFFDVRSIQIVMAQLGLAAIDLLVTFNPSPFPGSFDPH